MAPKHAANADQTAATHKEVVWDGFRNLVAVFHLTQISLLGPGVYRLEECTQWSHLKT